MGLFLPVENKTTQKMFERRFYKDEIDRAVPDSILSEFYHLHRAAQINSRVFSFFYIDDLIGNPQFRDILTHQRLVGASQTKGFPALVSNG